MVAINSVIKNLKSQFTNHNSLAIKPGIYHFDHFDYGEKARIHLRIDGDGNGLLLINANRILHLNPTAAMMVLHHLNDVDQDHVIKEIKKKFKVSTHQAIDDYTQTIEMLQELIKPDGACPIHTLDIDVIPPFSASPSAPYRMDAAITYRCNNDCLHCYNARSREYPELSTTEWLKVLNKLWELSIPHVVFTGGEPTLRDDLPQLIAHAENIGQITGINTNGRRLSNRRYVDDLVKAGLDHVQITLESHNPAIHDEMVSSNGAWKQTVAGIRNVLESPLYVMTNTTMLTNNIAYLVDTLEYLARIGVPTVGLNALIYSGKGRSVGSGLEEKDLFSFLQIARDITSNHNQRLIWYTPTKYCHFDPMQLELGVKGCTAAMYNMCIEPNGDVIPCQSYYFALGNILTTPWDKIWNHEVSQNIRTRKWIPKECVSCSLVRECGGGCPLVANHSIANQ